MHKKLIIAVDGHSSCGKSTLAKDIAKHYNYNYIDTGAMYRAVTLFVLEQKLVKNGAIDEASLQKAFEQNKLIIEFAYNPQMQKSETLLNGKNVEQEIRGIKVSELVSPVARIPFVRKYLVKLQQAMGKNGGIVMDGRDIGTYVFPDADIKFFVTAKAEIRAQRRYKELTERGDKVSFEEILKNIEERDYIDSHRETNPLRQAEDALLIDNSEIGIKEQKEKVIALIEKHLNNVDRNG